MTNVYEKINVELSEEKANGLPQTTDDLTKIKGIGSGTAEKLNVRKIYTYRQLTETTPEKLSEAPGIGVATARKIIEEAKRLLGGIQEENKAKLPELSKEEPVIAKKIIETYEIIDTKVEDNIERKELIQINSVTPYKQLLARSEDKIETVILEQEEIKTETEFDNIETFEVAEVIVEEDFPQEEFQIEEKPSETKTVPDVEEEIEEYQEEVPEVPERFENNAIVEHFGSEIPFPVEAISSEESFNSPIYTEPPEVPKIKENTKILPEVSEIIEVTTVSRTTNPREKLTKDITESLKGLGYYAIPRQIESLSPFFQNVDYIGLKLVSVKNNSKLLLLVPIKLCDLEGTLLIHEDKIDYKAYSRAQESNLIPIARQYADDLLKAKETMFEDVVNGECFQEFFEKYLQVRFAAKKSAKNKKLYFVSGQTQYKVLIEPILLTKIPAKCMEKSILYPYQRKTNLHVIDEPNIGHLLRFLEKKYKLIESRAKKTNSIETHENADAKFRSNLRVASLPFLGYSVVLLVIYFSQLYFLLRLLNSIGVAAIGIYSLAIAYFYFKFYKTKKELATEFETPYYLQNPQFNETDLLCVKEELTSEQMTQFGYECFGKDNDSKVLEELEKDKVKESVATKLREQDAPQLFELDSEPEDSSVGEKPKREIKYSSFLED